MGRANKITVQRGTTYAIGITYKQDGIVQDITGATILFTVKTVEYDSNPTDATAIIEKNVTVHTDPTHGKSEILLEPADTRELAPNTYYYSIKIDLESDDTIVYELAEGQLVIDADPTNRIIS